MGTGLYGGFGYTKGAVEAVNYKHFKPVHFKATVKVNGKTVDVSRKVYQRGDIDFLYIDPKTGMSNLQRMKKGMPPIGNDGKPIHLHHVIQKEIGPVVEIREITHKEYFRILHGIANKGESFRNNHILNKTFNNFRSAYWKWRAEEYEKLKRETD